MSTGSDQDACAALWARVSTADQNTVNQVAELRDWAQRRNLVVVQEFTTEDSAWARAGNGAKGAEFDRQRNALLEGARLGRYGTVLVWGIDRLSRRGAEDMLAFVRRLTETGCRLWSMKDPWVESTTDPFVRELMLGIFGTIARFESERRSERVKAGLKRRASQGLPVGGSLSKRGRDRRKRNTDGYAAAWTPERRAALAERNRARAQAQQDREPPGSHKVDERAQAD